CFFITACNGCQFCIVYQTKVCCKFSGNASASEYTPSYFGSFHGSKLRNDCKLRLITIYMLLSSLQQLRNHFNSGITKGYNFRKEQLKKLKASILKHEQDLYDS